MYSTAFNLNFPLVYTNWGIVTLSDCCMGFLWVDGFSFFHCVASPFHSFVTTLSDCHNCNYIKRLPPSAKRQVGTSIDAETVDRLHSSR